MTLKPPPGVDWLVLASTSPPRSGRAGTVSTRSMTTSPRCSRRSNGASTAAGRVTACRAGPQRSEPGSWRIEPGSSRTTPGHGAQGEQVVGQGGQRQPVHPVDRGAGRPGEGAGAVARAGHGSGHGSDGVAVAAQGGSDPAGEPGISGAGGEHGEGGG